MKLVYQRLFRRVVLAIFRCRPCYRDETVEAVKNGGVIVVCNHVSFLDGVLVSLVSPVPLVFGVDSEFSRRARWSVLGFAALTRMGFGRVVPLDAASPFGLRKLHQALKRGESVMVFPEGEISATGQPGEDKPGLSWLRAVSGTQVVRIEIRGAERSRFFAKAGRAWWPAITVTF